MKIEYKYFKFNLISAPAEERPSWFCINKNGFVLGVVKWFPRWKQYCSFLEDGTIFSGGCHIDIADFLKQVNERAKE